jgi:hypothetical protein
MTLAESEIEVGLWGLVRGRMDIQKVRLQNLQASLALPQGNTRINLEQVELSGLGASGGRLGLRGGLDWGENRLAADIRMKLFLADENSLGADFTQTSLSAALAGKPELSLLLSGRLDLQSRVPLTRLRELDQIQSLEASDFTLRAAGLEAGLQGALALPAWSGQGSLQVNGDLHELLAWLGYRLAAPEAGKNLRLEIRADSDGQLLELSALNLALDGLSFKSRASFNRGQGQAEINGALEGEAIRADNYGLISLAPAERQKPGAPPARREPTTEKPGGASDVFSWLAKAKAEIGLTIKEVTVGKFTFSQIKGRLSGENGRWELQPLDLAFLGGKIDLNASADFNPLIPELKLQARAANLNLAGLAPSLRQGRVSALTADLTAQANDKFTASLNGVSSFHLENMAFSLPLPAELGQSLPSLLELEQAGGDFKLSRGVAATANLQGRGSGMQAAGAGSIDLPRQSLNMRLRLRLPLGLRIIGSAEVPLIVSGAWDNPEISIDKAEMLKSAGQLLNEDLIRQGVDSLLPRLGR